MRDMLPKNMFVYNVRHPRREVVKELMKDAGECSNVIASVRLKNMTTPAIRRQLRKRLAESLAAKRKERAFAKVSMFDDRPRVDELEKLVAGYPALSQVDWDAKPVKSDMNCALWLAYHVRHCDKCTPTAVHKDCYFRLIYHFCGQVLRLHKLQKPNKRARRRTERMLANGRKKKNGAIWLSRNGFVNPRV